MHIYSPTSKNKGDEWNNSSMTNKDKSDHKMSTFNPNSQYKDNSAAHNDVKFV